MWYWSRVKGKIKINIFDVFIYVYFALKIRMISCLVWFPGKCTTISHPFILPHHMSAV